MALVLGCGHHLQVLRAVVVDHAVDVMDLLITDQVPP